MAQNGRASGSLADNAAVPSPCALKHEQIVDEPNGKHIKIHK